MDEPHPDTTLFSRKRVWQFALLIAAIAYLFVWDPLRNWWSFETRTVEVTSVRSLCAAFEGDHSIPIEVDRCDSLKARMADLPGIAVKPRTFVGFTYQSPADGSMQTASVVRERDDGGQPIAVGSRLTVRLSRSEAGLYRLP